MFNRLAIACFERIPQGGIKEAVRRCAMKLLPGLPLRAFLEPGSVYVLVGTPSPKKVASAARIVGPKGRVIVFEAERKNFERIKEHLDTAGVSNVTAMQRAVWSSRGIVNLTVSKSQFDHKVNVPDVMHDNDFVPDNYVGVEQVQSDTLDNLLADLGVDRPDFIEFHVNGAELEILKGMPKLLQQPLRLHIKGHARFKDSGQPINTQIVTELERHGFKTCIGRRTKAREEAEGWGYRAGDVYAVRT